LPPAAWQSRPQPLAVKWSGLFFNWSPYPLAKLTYSKNKEMVEAMESGGFYGIFQSTNMNAGTAGKTAKHVIHPLFIQHLLCSTAI